MKLGVVDDERTDRDGIRFLIEKFQFELEVAEAANGKLAMEYLQKYQDVDILLTDVKMPYMDGLQLAKYSKENRPDVILFVNGLPLVIVEVKSPSREETDASAAYRQLRNYMYEIPSMFIYNAVCVMSDLTTSKAGTITSGEDGFMEW